MSQSEDNNERAVGGGFPSAKVYETLAGLTTLSASLIKQIVNLSSDLQGLPHETAIATAQVRFYPLAESCILEGLALNRQSISLTDEQASNSRFILTAFQQGYTQRKRQLESLFSALTQGREYGYLVMEGNLERYSQCLIQPDFSLVTTRLQEIRACEVGVSRLHNLLFTRGPLANEANRLRPHLRTEFLEGSAADRWRRDRMLFVNLLGNILLQGRIPDSLSFTPANLLELKNMWDRRNGRSVHERKEEMAKAASIVLAYVQVLHQETEITEPVINHHDLLIYLKMLLLDINEFIPFPDASLSAERVLLGDIFGFTREDIERVSANLFEGTDTDDTPRVQVIELQQARNEVRQLLALRERDVESLIDDEGNDEDGEEITGAYLQAIEALSPAALYLLCETLLTSQADVDMFEIQTQTTDRTLIQLLKMLEATSFRNKRGTEIEEFNTHPRQRVQTLIRSWIRIRMEEYSRINIQNYEALLLMFPTSELQRYIIDNQIRAEEEDMELWARIPIETWVTIARRQGIHAIRTSGDEWLTARSSEKEDWIHLRNPDGSISTYSISIRYADPRIAGLFTKLPAEMLTQIAQLIAID